MEDLTRLRIWMTPTSMASIDYTTAETGYSRVDNVNRAVQIHALVVWAGSGRRRRVANLHLFEGQWVRITVKRCRWWHRIRWPWSLWGAGLPIGQVEGQPNGQNSLD